MATQTKPPGQSDASLADDDLNRRQAIGYFAVAAASFLPLGAACAARANQQFSPEMFGARGDGVADDYPALARLAAAVTRAGGGLVLFGRGKRYRVGQVQVTGGAERNDVSHISFEGCSDLTVDLNGSTIDVRGDFHRGADAEQGRQSFKSAVVPLRFSRCTDLAVRNGTMNGNAQLMPELGKGYAVSPTRTRTPPGEAASTMPR